MDTQGILAEVERQVAERLPGALLDRGVIIHAKHSFRHQCLCSYCELKREATYMIASLPSGIKHTIRGSDFKYVTNEGHEDFDGYRDYKKSIRKQIRLLYRARLKDAMAEINV